MIRVFSFLVVISAHAVLSLPSFNSSLPRCKEAGTRTFVLTNFSKISNVKEQGFKVESCLKKSDEYDVEFVTTFWINGDLNQTGAKLAVTVEVKPSKPVKGAYITALFGKVQVVNAKDSRKNYNKDLFMVYRKGYPSSTFDIMYRHWILDDSKIGGGFYDKDNDTVQVTLLIE